MKWLWRYLDEKEPTVREFAKVVRNLHALQPEERAAVGRGAGTPWHLPRGEAPAASEVRVFACGWAEKSVCEGRGPSTTPQLAGRIRHLGELDLRLRRQLEGPGVEPGPSSLTQLGRLPGRYGKLTLLTSAGGDTVLVSSPHVLLPLLTGGLCAASPLYDTTHV